MIGFLSPALAAAGLACVAVPVILHLILRRRRRPFEWAAMELVREALRRVERRRRIERWALLATRCLLVAFACAAIAGPFIGRAAANAGRRRTVVVVIDDAIASNERVGASTAFANSAEAARAAVGELAQGDRVAVVRTSRPGDGAGDPASTDLPGAIRRIESLSSTDLPGDLASAIETARSILAHPESVGTERSILVASALREGSLRSMRAFAPASPGDDPIRVTVVPAPAAAGGNVRVAAVRAERATGSVDDPAMNVRVTLERDRGDEAVVRTVRVTGDSLSSPGERRVELAPGESSREVVVPVVERAGDRSRDQPRAVAASIDPDAQPADDARASPVAGSSRIRAAIVDRRTFDGAGIDRLSQGDWVTLALCPSEPPAIDAATVDPAAFDARTCAGTDLVVIAQPQLLSDPQWRIVSSFVSRGGSCVVLPPAREDAHPWTGRLGEALGMPWASSIDAPELAAPASVGAVRRESGSLGGIAGELPQLAGSVDVFRTLRLDVPRGDASILLESSVGSPVAVTWSPPGARGSVTLFAVAMDPRWTTMPLKPLMVPVWQELAADARRRSVDGLACAVGSVPTVDVPGAAELRPRAPDGALGDPGRVVPLGPGGRASATIDRPGILAMVDARGESLGSFVAFTDPAAASVREVDARRVADWLAPVGALGGDSPGGAAASTAVRGPSGGGPDLAPWLLVAALALALLEAWLARRFSHATLTPAGAAA